VKSSNFWLVTDITGKENQVRANFTIRNGLKMVGEDIEENCNVRSFTV
jgi:hypothetical protein